MFTEKIHKMNRVQLEHSFKMQRLILCSAGLLVLLIVFFMATDNVLGVSITMLLIWGILIHYLVYLIRFQNGLKRMVTEELQPSLSLYGLQLLNAKKSILTKLNTSYSYAIMGDFAKAQDVLQTVEPKAIRRKSQLGNAVFYLQLQHFLAVLQGNLFDSNQYKSEWTSDMVGNPTYQSLLHKNEQTLQAISDIESGLSNPYFDTAEIRHKLDQVLCHFYQGKNELLLGNPEKARELFIEVAQENEEVYFVREARKLVEGLV